MISWDTSIPICSLFGIPVRLHVLFPGVLAVAVVDQMRSSWQYILWAVLLFGPILLLTVLVHELGHCLATRALGGRAHSILLWPLGGLAFVGHAAGPKEDLLVAIAGPITNLLQGLVWFLFLLPTFHASYRSYDLSPLWAHWPPLDPQKHFWIALFAGAVKMNFYVMLFNLLLPAYPLDGGRIFVDMMLICGLPEKLVAMITFAVASVIGSFLIFWGVYDWQVFTMLVGAWVLFACFDLFRSIKKDKVDDHPLFLFDDAPNTPLYFYEELYDNR